jgi:ribosomal protein S18 acetylase RimI-like enzyme
VGFLDQGHGAQAAVTAPPGNDAAKVTMRGLREEDFADISSRVDEWWGRPVRGSLLRLFFEHFRPMSHVAEHDGGIVGFIVGFHSQSDPSVAYAHFIAVRPEGRRSGIGRALYDRFFDDARQRGCTAVEAITAPINTRSVAFHKELGFSVLPGGAVVEGVAVSVDHEGPGQHRVRMRREL